MSTQSPRPCKTRTMLRKRSLGVVPSGSSSSSSPPPSGGSGDSTVNCPICYGYIQDAYMTRCGHSFCHDCIKRSLESRPKCPMCSCDLLDSDGKQQIFPNLMLNDLIAKARRCEKKPRLTGIELSTRILQLFSEEKSMNVDDVNHALEILKSKKREMESNSQEIQVTLLKEFLSHLSKMKQEELGKIKSDIQLLEQDLSFLDTFDASGGTDWKSFDNSEDSRVHTHGRSLMLPQITDPQPSGTVQSVLAARRFRMHSHFPCLEECYFSARQLHRDEMPPNLPPAADLAMDTGAVVPEEAPPTPKARAPAGLERFAESLSKFTRYSQLRSLSTLNYASDLLNGTSIVSSIEFDKDKEYFAIAGVTKRIKMFEYATVIRDDVDMHYPVNEMVCNSKISCISWSSYHKGMLACSDYEGTVTLWDAYRTHKVKLFQEHEKRCWSVDFNKVDTKLLASGSDDTKVKLWAINQEHSITSIEAKANVCCVRFNPDSMYHLAMGSADHCVHYYDLRNCKTSLGVFKGHKKAVSYVKFLNSRELVSASTDSQLKLWKTDDPQCMRSFTGHINEKNFVGLATDGDYIACGSENNSLYIYYKGLSTQIQTWSFKNQAGTRDDGTVPTGGGGGGGNESNEFVSAVCWMSGSAVVVAANSQGTIKLLELV